MVAVRWAGNSERSRFADSILASSGTITTTATSTGSPLLIWPSFTNTFGPPTNSTIEARAFRGKAALLASWSKASH